MSLINALKNTYQALRERAGAPSGANVSTKNPEESQLQKLPMINNLTNPPKKSEDVFTSNQLVPPTRTRTDQRNF